MRVEIQACSRGIEEKSSSFALEASLISELLRSFTASWSAAAEIENVANYANYARLLSRPLTAAG